MKHLKHPILTAAVIALGLLPIQGATGWYGMHGPGWDWPTGIYTPGKARALAHRQALRDWWYAPLRGDSDSALPVTPYRGYGDLGDRYGYHRGFRPWPGRHWRY